MEITPHKALAFIVLGAIFNFNGMLCCHALAVTTALASRKLTLARGPLLYLNRAIGVLFVSFGLKLALADSK